MMGATTKALAALLVASLLAPLALAQTTDNAQSATPATVPTPNPTPPPPPCTDAAYRQFDFWIGTWRVTTPKGQYAGDNVITEAANGCLLIEHWQGAQGSSGQSYNFYDINTSTWRQLWVSPGVIIDYAGGLIDGAMQLTGKISYQNGTQEQFRGTWTPLKDGSVRQALQQFNRAAEQWDDWFVGIYVRSQATQTSG